MAMKGLSSLRRSLSMSSAKTYSSWLMDRVCRLGEEYRKLDKRKAWTKREEERIQDGGALLACKCEGQRHPQGAVSQGLEWKEVFQPKSKNKLGLNCAKLRSS